MELNDKHQKLRQLLIDKITECNSSLKPSKVSLNKMLDEELVLSLFVNSVEAEKEIWYKVIIGKIVKFEPNTEYKYKNAGINLLTDLIKIVQENGKTKNL